MLVLRVVEGREGLANVKMAMDLSENKFKRGYRGMGGNQQNVVLGKRIKVRVKILNRSGSRRKKQIRKKKNF